MEEQKQVAELERTEVLEYDQDRSKRESHRTEIIGLAILLGFYLLVIGLTENKMQAFLRKPDSMKSKAPITSAQPLLVPLSEDFGKEIPEQQ